jgi:hypothetical protein
MLQASVLFQAKLNDGRGQRGKGNKVKGKDPLCDMRPYGDSAMAGPCAAAVVAAIRAHPDADWYAAYDPGDAGCSICVILARGSGSLSGLAKSISMHAVGRDYILPGYALGFLMLNEISLVKAAQSCCAIPVPGISDASCGDAARESLAGALHIALARA